MTPSVVAESVAPTFSGYQHEEYDSMFSPSIPYVVNDGEILCMPEHERCSASFDTTVENHPEDVFRNGTDCNMAHHSAYDRTHDSAHDSAYDTADDTANDTVLDGGECAYASVSAHSNTRAPSDDTAFHSFDSSVERSGDFFSSEKNISPPPQISQKKKSKEMPKRRFGRWKENETKTLIAGVNTYGLKWARMKDDHRFKTILASRSSVDLKDKWRNIIYKDFKNGFSIRELDILSGPVDRLKEASLIKRALQNGNRKYVLGEWKKLAASDAKLKKIKTMGEVEVLTINRCNRNKDGLPLTRSKSESIVE